MVDWSSVAIVLATFLGPIAAVQAQKWLERRGEIDKRKVDLFTRLMATRAARLSQEHVRSLNLIDLVFYGERTKTGRIQRSKEDGEVIAAWREYYNHLNADQSGWNDQQTTGWAASNDEIFLNLLEKMAIATRHQFDRPDLRSAGYNPQAHAVLEFENQTTRRLVLELLSGQRPLTVRPYSAPAAAAAPDPAAS